MSENWITVIPDDPFARPDETAVDRLKAVFAEIAPRAAEIRIEGDGEAIRFFDAGANFQRVACPDGTPLDIADWRDAMSRDYDGTGFRLGLQRISGCAITCRVSDLVSDWPQGFARIGVSARDADIGPLTHGQKTRLAEALGQPVRVIYRHI